MPEFFLALSIPLEWQLNWHFIDTCYLNDQKNVVKIKILIF